MTKYNKKNIFISINNTFYKCISLKVAEQSRGVFAKKIGVQRGMSEFPTYHFTEGCLSKKSDRKREFFENRSAKEHLLKKSDSRGVFAKKIGAQKGVCQKNRSAKGDF